VAALLNIKIPLLLGDLVNVIAGFLKDNAAMDLSRINPIAGQLLLLYAGQVCHFFYFKHLNI